MPSSAVLSSLPSEIQRSDDWVGMAMPIWPLSWAKAPVAAVATNAPAANSVAIDLRTFTSRLPKNIRDWLFCGLLGSGKSGNSSHAAQDEAATWPQRRTLADTVILVTDALRHRRLELHEILRHGRQRCRLGLSQA